MKSVLSINFSKVPYQTLRDDLVTYVNHNPRINEIIFQSEILPSFFEMQCLQDDLNNAIGPRVKLGFQQLIPKSTFCVLLDFDGCTDTEIRKQRVIEDIVHFLKDNSSIKKIVVMITSLRQSVDCDLFNAHNNKTEHEGRLLSCSELGVFHEKIDAALREANILRKIELVFDPMLIGDLINALEQGETYRFMQRMCLMFETPAVVQGWLVNKKFIEWNDLTKWSTITVQLEHIVQCYGPSYVRFYDDRLDLLEELDQSLKNYVPATLVFDYAQMDQLTDKLQIPSKPIVGGNQTRVNYRAMIVFFAEYFGDTYPSIDQLMNAYALFIESENQAMKVGLLKPEAHKISFFTPPPSRTNTAQFQVSEHSAFTKKSL